MKLDYFDYDLPKELIAQKPCEKRDQARLMVLDREKKTIEHKHFYDILEYLKPGDCLVFNNSKVIPARIFGEKRGTGAKVEFLLTKRIDGDIWQTMVRPGRRLKPGDVVDFGDEMSAEILDYDEGGTRKVKLHYEGVFLEVLDRLGNMPLPPYIEREAGQEDKEWYQTVYCDESGSVAAPTAGLHFTNELLEKIKEKGIDMAFLTLHVGIGTFRPVKVENIEDHQMHFEEYHVSKTAADTINKCKRNGGRIIAVGTTSTRTLESAAVYDPGLSQYRIAEGADSTGIFIYPGYEFKLTDALVTNFHLPKSTLLMLVSALYNRDDMIKAYEEAVREKYRFFSYGDAMFIY